MKTDRFPAHVPVRVGTESLCSIMCDHPGIVRETSHQAAVDSWRAQADTATDNGGQR